MALISRKAKSTTQLKRERSQEEMLGSSELRSAADEQDKTILRAQLQEMYNSCSLWIDYALSLEERAAAQQVEYRMLAQQAAKDREGTRAAGALMQDQTFQVMASRGAFNGAERQLAAAYFGAMAAQQQGAAQAAFRNSGIPLAKTG